MHNLRLLPLLLTCAIAIAADSAPGGIVLAQRGAALAGPVQVQVKGLAVNGSVLAWGDIAVAALPGAVADALDGGVVTAEGEILRGVVRQLDKGELAVASDLHGELRLPVASVAAVVLVPVRFADLAGVLAGEPGALLANGERVAGTMTFCNAEAVGIDTGRRVAQVPRARVAAVVLRAPRPAQAARERVWLGLASGGRLLAESIAASGAILQVKGPSGTASIDPRLVAQVVCDGGRVTHLADLAPTRTQALDRAGAIVPVAAGAGFPAVLGGLPASAGVMLAARGEIAWKAPSGGTFVAWAACPADGADAVASVVLDGTVAWEQTLRAGAASLAVSVPLKGASEIALRSAPGPAGETARCTVAWCHPLLVK